MIAPKTGDLVYHIEDMHAGLSIYGIIISLEQSPVDEYVIGGQWAHVLFQDKPSVEKRPIKDLRLAPLP
tara:strand:- start:579 stop:785 length:207 start_codon:yes stop_codon:yes gene_type:complete